MSKLKCKCGYSMSNSDSPSENIIRIFRKEKVLSDLKSNPNVTLFDFETSYNDVFEYWYCTDCKRAYVVERIPNGKVIERYQMVDCEEKATIEGKEAIYIFKSTEIYESEEKNFELTLKAYIEDNGESHIYYLDNEKEKVYKPIEGGLGVIVYKIEK